MNPLKSTPEKSPLILAYFKPSRRRPIVLGLTDLG